MELFDYNVDIQLGTGHIHPREDIVGQVKIKVFTALFLTHAYIEISGKAKSSWKTKNKYFFPRKIVWNGEQEFFYCRHTLAGNDDTEVIMNKNNYLYNFKCKLPGHLPASSNGEYGSIKYTAQVVIRSDKEIIGKHSQEIRIYPYRNLKFEPHLFSESRKDIRRKFRFGFLSLGDVHVSLWLPICGLAAGQGLPVICTINNKSSVQFGGIIFCLTKLEIYRSNTPKYSTKIVRTDICRVPRLTEVLKGFMQYYCVLQTDKTALPTTQYWRCSTYQICYEAWVQLQGSLPKNNAYGYPNIDMPGIPVIIGTHPLCNWNLNHMTNQVMQTLLESQEPIVMDPPPPDEVVEEILNTVDDEFDFEMMANLSKQIAINDTVQKKK